MDETAPQRGRAIERAAAAVAILVAVVGVVAVVVMARVDSAAAASPHALRSGRAALAASVHHDATTDPRVLATCVGLLVIGVGAVLLTHRHDASEP